MEYLLTLYGVIYDATMSGNSHFIQLVKEVVEGEIENENLK